MSSLVIAYMQAWLFKADMALNLSILPSLV